MWRGPCQGQVCCMPRKHCVFKANYFPLSCLLQSASSQRPREDDFDILDSKPSVVIRVVSFLWFPPAAPLPPMVAGQIVNWWEGCWGRLGFGCFLQQSPAPSSGEWHQFLLTPVSQLLSFFWSRRSTTLGLYPRQTLGDLSALIDGPDFLSTVRKTSQKTGGLQLDCPKLAIYLFTAKHPYFLPPSLFTLFFSTHKLPFHSISHSGFLHGASLT